MQFELRRAVATDAQRRSAEASEFATLSCDALERNLGLRTSSVDAGDMAVRTELLGRSLRSHRRSHRYRTNVSGASMMR